jgi:hypothetical protein
MKLKVRDCPEYVRDSNSKAIVNLDTKAYEIYRQEQLLRNNMRNLYDEVSELKTEFSEIKTLLYKILNNTAQYK